MKISIFPLEEPWFSVLCAPPYVTGAGHVVGVDIDADALELARDNCAVGMSNRLGQAALRDCLCARQVMEQLHQLEAKTGGTRIDPGLKAPQFPKFST